MKGLCIAQRRLEYQPPFNFCLTQEQVLNKSTAMAIHRWPGQAGTEGRWMSYAFCYTASTGFIPNTRRCVRTFWVYPPASVLPNPSVERTCNGGPGCYASGNAVPPSHAPHVKR